MLTAICPKRCGMGCPRSIRARLRAQGYVTPKNCRPTLVNKQQERGLMLIQIFLRRSCVDKFPGWQPNRSSSLWQVGGEPLGGTTIYRARVRPQPRRRPCPLGERARLAAGTEREGHQPSHI